MTGGPGGGSLAGPDVSALPPATLPAAVRLEHERWMRVAIGLARRGAGRTWPNPNVGCLLLRDGQVVGRGWTRPGGRPHAEAVALAEAGERARGATAYVTLEPCAHHGQTPPCAEALVAAGIAACVIAVDDPDPRVDGRGKAILRAAGIALVDGICADEAAWTVRGFLQRIRSLRPWVTVKLATSLDGRITAADGRSQWITDLPARNHGHLLRAQHDAILVGTGTLRADDPQLTCRLPGLGGRSPVRVVMASGAGLPMDSRLLAGPGDGDAPPVWLAHGDALPSHMAAELQRRGLLLLHCAGEAPGDPRPAPQAVLQALAARGITSLLLEGGAGLATAFLQAGLADMFAWYRAGRVLGAGGLPALGALPAVDLATAADWRLQDRQALGVDVLETYVRAG
ncbi:bifunctional diaminohydroxyphosphoribosylaminopyrimidine deaminase/5-amino-6-(5-phosphoribosylamino)uracil reductase RibD [Marinibaculum pumilum]|uniref:Riboflavin biosynthesis protein RibD n=1 Tax=Marinibaculum pumilum TaxID=1766165 RepID=A0ABV7KU12_9PROT